MTDVTLLTCQAYYKPDKITPYIQNILFEEQLLKSALEKHGLIVDITYWDNPSYDWSKTKSVIFRTIWDYFEKFEEFLRWLDKAKCQTQLINSYELVKWNIDKHYLKDLDCLGCYGQFECPYNARCMTDIKVSDVYKSIGELIWN